MGITFHYLDKGTSVVMEAILLIWTCMQIAKQFKATLESGVGNEYARLHLEALKREMLASEIDKDFIT